MSNRRNYASFLGLSYLFQRFEMNNIIINFIKLLKAHTFHLAMVPRNLTYKYLNIIGSWHKTGSSTSRKLALNINYKYDQYFDYKIYKFMRINKIILFIRHPFEIIKSAVNYHLNCNELWLKEKPLYSYKIHNYETTYLRTSSQNFRRKKYRHR